MYNTRVKGRQILLENPARESRAKKELEAKRAAKKKEERKRLGVIGKKGAKEKGMHGGSSMKARPSGLSQI